ncbi:MAG: thiamine pyrophosphate-dependent enzyme [Pseudonocardiaceae bacterium]
MLAITGMQETGVLGTGYQQEVNLPALFADLADYNQMVTNPQQVLGLVDNAVRTARSRRGVAHLSVPNDIQIAGAEDDPYAHPTPVLPQHGSTVLPRRFGVPAPEQLAAAAEVLNAAQRPAILAGAGALGARYEVSAVAHRLGAPVIKTLPGKAVIPDDVALSVGGIGLLPLLEQHDDAHLKRYQAKMDEWRAQMAALENPDRTPIAPQYVVGLIDELATDDAIFTCDSGTIATWAARHWTIRGERQFYLSANLATMAPGLPYAIAMQHAFPGQQVIAYVGDGGFSMLMAEFLTAVRQRLPITVVINNNNSLGQILFEQMVLGYPEHGVRYGEPVADFAAWASACGGYGAKVRGPTRAAAARQGQLRAGDEVRSVVAARSAAQSGDRQHPVQGPHLPAAVVTSAGATPAPVRRPRQTTHEEGELL